MFPRKSPKKPKALSSQPKQGLFISFDGLDGSGKSTQARNLAEAFGDRAVLLKEPTDGHFGKTIRKIASTKRHRPLLEHRLFIQDREWDIKYNIQPAIDAGNITIIDRYIVSNLAYQGALGISLNAILEDNSDFPWPDLIIVLKIDVDTALKRIKKSKKTIELFEHKEYLQKVDKIINSINLPNVLFIDGNLKEDRLSETIFKLATAIV
jgi:dTMP kinase